MILYLIVGAIVLGLLTVILRSRGFHFLKTERCPHCGYIWNPSAPNNTSSTKQCPWCENES